MNIVIDIFEALAAIVPGIILFIVFREEENKRIIIRFIELKMEQAGESSEEIKKTIKMLKSMSYKELKKWAEEDTQRKQF